MIGKLAFSGLALAVIAGCTPKQYETPPVTLQTSQGDVICQLYTEEIVQWDRSIMRPDSMHVKTADALCVEEGKRLQALAKERSRVGTKIASGDPAPADAE